MKLTTNLFLSTLALSVALTGCGQSGEEKPAEKPAEQAETPAATEGEVIRIATEGAYPPMNFTNADGSLAGFDIDITNALCEEMKAKCEIVAQDWEGIIGGLKAEKYDAIIAAMSITDERKEAVDFSDPYFSSGLILLAKADSDLGVDKLDGKKVGAQKSTIALTYLKDNFKGVDVKSYDTQESVNADLANSRLDATLVDQVVGTAWLSSDGAKGFEQKGETISTGKDDMGIAVRKGDALSGKFNTALAAIKANGTYETISAKYFGSKEAAAE